MRTHRLAAISIGLAVVLASAVLAYRMDPLHASAESVATTSNSPRTAVVEMRTISSVLVLEGTVVSNPVFRVCAPRSGTVELMSGKRVGIRGKGQKRATALKLPAGSTSVNFLVEPGTLVTTDVPVVDAQLAGYGLQATIPTERLYRLYDGIANVRGEIVNGPGPFASKALGVPFVPETGLKLSVAEVAASAASQARAAASAANEDEARRKILAMVRDALNAASAAGTGVVEVSPELAASVRSGQDSAAETVLAATPEYATQMPDAVGAIVVCTAPADLRLIEGLPCLIALTTAPDTKGLALPVEAVAGVSQKGQVYLVTANGTTVTRTVELGVSDGTYVQILSGLREGDTVALPSPSIDALRR